MRRDGDLLLEHLSRAKETVLLCAPFIKAGVAKRLLAAIHPGVRVEIVTRWHAEEVAAGVSDLAVFELAAEREGTTLRLLDNLHAKLFLSDDKLLAGSANLTAKALGWCADPNLELLVGIDADQDAVRQCLAGLAAARTATADERDAIQALSETLHRPPMPESQAGDEVLSGLWLPMLAAPERLFAAYTQSARERLTSSALKAADHDLSALAIPAGLKEAAFRAEVAERFAAMPAIGAILTAAASDLTDASAVDMVQSLAPESGMPAAARWQIVREWLTYFMRDKYEIAPQSFVTRLRPGAGRT